MTNRIAAYKSLVFTAANERTKAPNAAAKLDAVLALIEHCVEAAGNDKPSLEIHTALVTLYKQHLPKTPAKPKTAFTWVNKAIAKKDVRYYLNQAHIEAGRVRATDGHRVHVAPSDIKEDGFYDTAQNKVDMSGKFPDIDRVTPTSGKGRISVDVDALINPRVIVVKGIPTAVIREPETRNDTDMGLHICLKYLNDALSNPASITSVTAGDSAYDSMMINFSDNSYAVIMPVKAN